MNRDLLNKLKIKNGHSLLVINSTDEYLKNFGNVHNKPTAKTKYDFVQLFVSDKSELEEFGSKAIRALKEDGLFWISYPKKSSALKTDLSRDHGWNIIQENGFEVVSLIAIDDVWSALRCALPKNNLTKGSYKSAIVSN